uniref:FXYD domain-containing ion transport regulator n=1 Tax=Gopherus agassizii TaxID=38772 RepID=A0A452GMA7_9SAUR
AEGGALEVPLGQVLTAPLPPDWHRLRVGGLIAAGILCALGVIVLLSGKCKCKFNRKARRPNESPHLITPGSASNS